MAAVAIGIVVALIGAGRLLRAGPTARRALSPVLAPGALAGAAEAAYAVALIRNPFEDPDDPVFSSVFIACSLSLALLALGLTWSVVQARRRRLIVSRLAAGSASRSNRCLRRPSGRRRGRAAR